MYEPSGALVSNFPVGSSVRDVTVDDDRVYLLYPTRVEVYDLEGGWIRDWEACSEESDYCSLTVLIRECLCYGCGLIKYLYVYD